MIVNLEAAGFKAFITVTYPSGTCTVTHKESGISYSHSGGDTHTFTVNKKGRWTISAKDGASSDETEVEITQRGQVAPIVLSYELVLFDGSLAKGYSLNDYYISPAIDMSLYSELVVTASHYEGYTGSSFYVGICENPSSVSYNSPPKKTTEFLSTLGDTFVTKTINISNYNSEMYIGFWDAIYGGKGFSVSDGVLAHEQGRIYTYIQKIVLH